MHNAHKNKQTMDFIIICHLNGKFLQIKLSLCFIGNVGGDILALKI